MKELVRNHLDATTEIHLVNELNFYNNLLNQAEKIAKLGHWQWNICTNEIIWSNNLFNIYGIERGDCEMDFQKFMNRIHKEDRSFVETNIQNALVTNQFHEFYHRIVRPDGEIRILHARGEVISDASGNAIKMMGTTQDVTEIKLAEQELFLKASELENKNAELRSFAYVASHDLQEPLRKLTVFCSLLQTSYTDKLDTKANEYLQKIVNSSVRLRTLINNILEVSNIPADKKFSNVDLNVVLTNVLADLESSIEASQAKILTDTLPILEANETQI